MVDVFMTRALRNILYFVLGLLLGCVSALSFAADGTDAGVPAVQYTPMIWSFGNTIGPSIPEVCNKLKTQMESGGNPPEWEEPPTPLNQPAGSGIMYCRYKTKDAAYQYPQIGGSCPTGYQMDLAHPTPFDYRCKTGVQCPVGSSLASGKCTCNPGLVFYDGQCKSPVCTNNGSVGVPSFYAPDGYSAPDSACIGGCKASGALTVCSPSKSKIINGIKNTECSIGYKYGGQGSSDRCTGADPSPGVPGSTPESCGPNQGMVKVGGVTKCYNQNTGGEASTAPPTTETKNSTSTTTQNPNGTTTVTNVTNNVTTGGTTTVVNSYSPPCTDPATCTPTSTTTSTTGGGANGEANPKPSSGSGEGDKDACEDDPERVGCKHLDEITGEVPDGPDISNSQENLTFTPVSGFGSGSYSCPQNPTMTLSLLGKSITAFDYGPACQFANGIRPLVVAFAALAAALIGLGVGRRD